MVPMLVKFVVYGRVVLNELGFNLLHVDLSISDATLWVIQE